MKDGLSGTGLMLLAIVFSVALTFATVEGPRFLNEVLYEEFGDSIFPRADSGNEPAVTEAFIQRYALRPIGYAACLLVLVLIVAGIVAEKRGFAATGAVALFLPVFGHFAMSMFFLAGLGLLRTIWLPFLEISYGITGDLGHGIFRLGDVAVLPYMVVVYLVALAGIDARVTLPYAVMGIGLWLFVLGVMAWFYTRSRGKEVADLWVYRISRHPQYLGWIVWSYGLMLFFIRQAEGGHFKISWGIPDSLPWMASALVIVGVALLEEIKMSRDAGERYDTYRERTPFLFPLPRIAVRIVSWPMRLALRREWPENGRDVLVTVGVYAVILMLLSYAVVELGIPRYGRLDLWPYTVWPFE